MTVKKPVIREVHERRCRIIIDRHTLTQILKAHALNASGFSNDATEVNITFSDVTEGSPGYKVGTECLIDLVEDQLKLPKAGEA